jgi:hypothetical protein
MLLLTARRFARVESEATTRIGVPMSTKADAAEAVSTLPTSPGVREGGMLRSIADIALVVNASSDLGTVLDRIVYAVCRHSAWSMSSIMSVDSDTDRSVLVARFDPYAEEGAVLPREWKLSTSPAAAVTTMRIPVIIEDAQASEEYADYRADARARGFRTVVILPLPARDAQGRAMVLAVQARGRVSVLSEDLNFLSTVCELAAIAVAKADAVTQERQRAERIKLALDASRELSQRVLREASVAEVLSAIENLRGQAVVLIDVSAMTVWAGRPPSSISLDSAAWLGRVTSDVPAWLQCVRDTEGATGLPALRDLTPIKIEALRYGKSIVGALALIGVPPKDAVGELIAEQTRTAASLLLMRSQLTFGVAAEVRADVMTRLIKGGWTDPSEIAARARRAGFAVDRPSRLLGLARARGQDSGKLISNLRAIEDRLSGRIPGAICVCGPVSEDQAPVVLVWWAVPEPALEKLALAALPDTLCTILGSNTIVALSEQVLELEAYGPAWRSVLRAVHLARRFQRVGCIRESDFGSHALLLASAADSTFDAFVKATLGKVEAYDKEHSTELLNTLRAHLRTSCRYQQTADGLGVHVATVRYRLERLSTQFNVDLDDADQRFSYDLALRYRALGRP